MAFPTFMHEAAMVEVEVKIGFVRPTLQVGKSVFRGVPVETSHD